ncbi:hypothetical protein LTS10_007781 [Elasticomyces elasticus]|nr:hypothetical protein LTS10_007781 [Elasticomyces elasticus]
MFTEEYTYFVFLFRKLPAELRDQVYTFTFASLAKTIEERCAGLYDGHDSPEGPEMRVKDTRTLIVHTFSALDMLVVDEDEVYDVLSGALWGCDDVLIEVAVRCGKSVRMRQKGFRTI